AQIGDFEVREEPPQPPIEEREDEVFTFVEVMPSFVGGEEAMIAYIRSNIHYPEFEKESGKQGLVFISFIVEKDGSISTVQARKEVPDAPGLTKEAIRLVSSMPNWTPGKINGRIVRTTMNLPIRFVLQ
ncbi:MAG: energy transducer TonB, partial [Bacteroidia bacterium]